MEENIENAFKENFELQRIFRKFEKEISRGSDAKKERLIQRRDALLQTLRKIDLVELEILFYIAIIDDCNKYRVLERLRRRYNEQCRFKEEFYGFEKSENLFRGDIFK